MIHDLIWYTILKNQKSIHDTIHELTIMRCRRVDQVNQKKKKKNWFFELEEMRKCSH